MKRVYLDFAASAPVHKAAKVAFLDALSLYGNPSSAHEHGRQARAVLEEARRGIASLASARPEQVLFTSGATEANALAIEGSIRARLRAGEEAKDIHVLFLPGAHASITGAIESLAERGIRTEPLILTDGAIDLASLKNQLRSDTALIAVEAVSAETGTRFDTLGIRRTLDASASHGAPRPVLHVDASQLPFIESFERTRLGADFLTLDAQKVGGVRGIGALIVSASAPLMPIVQGGGQEQGIRPGTPAPALATAFAAALADCAKRRTAFRVRATHMREVLVQDIQAEIEQVRINEGKEQAPHILNLSLIGRDTDYLATLLDRRGFSVSTKSACEVDSEEGSRAVLAQTGDLARASSTLRISWGPDTAESDLRRFSKALSEAVSFLDRNSV